MIKAMREMIDEATRMAKSKRALLSPRVSLASFALDVAFFVAVGVSIIQLYRGITGKLFPPEPPASTT
jgi:hypothetical protein